MASVAHRIEVLIDLFMGAVYADERCDHSDRDYVRAPVGDRLCKSRRHPQIDALIDRF